MTETGTSRLFQWRDKSPLRALSLLLALWLAGCIFWDPRRFAANSSPLEIWQGLLMMWAVCTGVIHGVGFRPRHWRWQVFFSPLPAWFVLLAGLFFFYL
ncbi:cyd operon protein YbgE [Erwinia sp. E_sp_W01_6]|uniref:cyd operon protein YbgE n=1 Tax=unclassified Erwinia TaxID=2622719 RepID=UPI0030D158DD